MVGGSKIFLVLTLILGNLIGPSLCLADEKVAVIISSGDLDQLEDSMRELEQKATKTYESLGFKVVLIGGVDHKGAKLSPEVLTDKLQRLEGVKDLRIDFIGHGALVRVPEDLFKGPGVPISSERLAQGVGDRIPSKPGKYAWFASNASTADVEYYGPKAKMFGFAPEKTQNLNHLDVKSALEKFRAKNPDSDTTINLLNCYSGALAQELGTTPHTTVFAASPFNAEGVTISSYVRSKGGLSPQGEGFIRSATALGNYYDSLGASKVDNLTLLDARKSANERMRQELIMRPVEHYLLGRSPIYESVIGWCEDGYKAKIDPVRSKEQLQELASKNRSSNAISFLISEKERIQQGFNFSFKVPSYGNPEQTLMDQLKAEHDRCMTPDSGTLKARQKEKADQSSSFHDWQRLRGQYASDPAKPLQMLFQKFEEALNNSANHDLIFSRVKWSVELDLRNLQREELSESRWGSIRSVINGIRNGSIKQNQIIDSLKQYVGKMKSDCSTSQIEKSPCREYSLTLKEMAESVFNPTPNSEDQCKGKEPYFECLYQGNPQPRWISELTRYWSPRQEPSISDADECSQDSWTFAQKGKENIDLDVKCIQTFLASAPENELSNLERIFALSQRDARGFDETQAQMETKAKDLAR